MKSRFCWTRTQLAAAVLSVGMAIAGNVLATVGEPSLAPVFTRKPVATRDGGNLKISFAVNRETDVAVYIENAKGEIVRRLAAGALGKNPPEPLKANTLDQTIIWDGLDDDGRPAAGGPFQARVGLGLKAAWGGVAFADADKSGPNRMDCVLGLAAGPDGRVYAIDKWAGLAWWSLSRIHVFRRDGSYEKTVKPFPPNLPLERLKGVGAFVNSYGAINPLLYRAASTTYYPQEEMPQQLAITPDGHIVLATEGDVSVMSGAPTSHLALLDTDGGIPENGYTAPALGVKWLLPHLTASADGKALYVTGVRSAAHAVYRTKLPERGPMEVVFGVPAVAGSDSAHLSSPRGTAIDGQGHLLIADTGNNRVVVVNEADKSFAGSFVVQAPVWVAVNPRDGTIYVCAEQSQFIKFSGWKDARELARMDCAPLVKKSYPNMKNGNWGMGTGSASYHTTESPLFPALDTSAEPAILWVGCGNQLVRYEDQGAKFGDPIPARFAGTQFFWRPAVDPTRKQVACRIERGPNGWGGEFVIMDEATGQTRMVGGVGGKEGRNHRLGPDGCIYAVDHSAGVIRWDRDGNAKPFAATVNDRFLRGRLPAGDTGTTMWERDFWVDRKNNIYVRRNGPAYHARMTLDQYDQQGNFVRTLLWEVSDGMYGPRVDARGNIYIMDAVKAPGEAYPQEFKDRIAANGPGARWGLHWYDWIYGSVIKFSPAGGAIWFAKGRIAPASPLNYEGWRAWNSEPRDSSQMHGAHDDSVVDLRTTGGSLVASIARKPATLAFPWPCALDAAKQNRITIRLKNESDGQQAMLGWHVMGEGYATRARFKTIAIQPNSDFTEYTFDLSGEKEWKGTVFNLTLIPTDAAKGSFRIDWVRIGDADSKLAWNFNAEDSKDKKAPEGLKKENVGSYGNPRGTELEGAVWWRPGFGHVGVCTDNDHCHCCGSDFDMDDFGRIFAPDTGRCRVGVLDSNGNEILSFGAYGNQDFSGPDSYVIDPATKLLRPRAAADPKELRSPFAQPELAFAWIIGVAVSDKYAYVDDMINKRVLRVKLDYAATETCVLP